MFTPEELEKHYSCHAYDAIYCVLHKGQSLFISTIMNTHERLATQAFCYAILMILLTTTKSNSSMMIALSCLT